MKAIHHDLLTIVDPSWHSLIIKALERVDLNYLQTCFETEAVCPPPQKIFSAFSLPKAKVRYLLLGESPYPRLASANGYAFWDAAVHELWSERGLSQSVNRATSLRNLLKMLLYAEGLLAPPFLAQNIAQCSKDHLVQTLDELFSNFIDQGFLLLNASLVWSKHKPVHYHAKQWFSFNSLILHELAKSQVQKFLLFGKFAQKFSFLPAEKQLIAEHPYVLSFIQNQDVLSFFKPLHLLRVSV